MTGTHLGAALELMTADEVQAAQLELLDRFHRYADDRALTWFLYGGTLLGAARHQGYIPWDDDIDIAMPRKDYQHFLALMKVDPIPGASLKALGTDAGYPFPFAKLSLTGTRLVEPFDPWPKVGVNIDIFPIDDWPDKEAGFRPVLRVLTALVWLRIIPAGWGRNPARRLVIGMARRIARMFPARLFGSLIDGLSGAGCDEDRAGVIVWGVRESNPWSAYLPTATLPFEGRLLPVPGQWDRVLTSIYGDWRQPPPEEERPSGHQFEAYRLRSAN